MLAKQNNILGLTKDDYLPIISSTKIGGEMMITKEMLISDVLKANPNAADILKNIGMHCFGCAIASMETVEQAAEVHGVDLEKLIADLNK